jgi:hypothetical protein
MSFRDAIDQGRQAMDDAKGDTFTVMGVTGTFVGNFNEVTSDPTLQMGGFLEGITHVCFASRAQFGAAPAKGQTIIRDGERFKIASISKDPSKYVLNLTGVNR